LGGRTSHYLKKKGETKGKDKNLLGRRGKAGERTLEIRKKPKGGDIRTPYSEGKHLRKREGWRRRETP